MALPSELILKVCKHLPKSALKACRLVSKSWSHHASEYLFSKIYISPRKEDIEVFNFITQHSQLKGCVRRLEYDGTSFSPSYSKNYYIYHSILLAKADYALLGRTDLNSRDLQYTQFIKSCLELSRNVDPAEQVIQEPSSRAFVLEGFREWQNREEYHQRIVKNGEFLQILARGLRRLDSLKSVEVCNGWDTWRVSKKVCNPYYYGSPFGRAWGLSHPAPYRWENDASPEEGFATGHDEFQIITTALSQSQRHICSFNISRLPVTTFDPSVTAVLGNLSINAYSSLENLTLHLNDSVKLREVAVKHKPLSGLQALLRSMVGLRRLQLSLPRHPAHWGGLLTYRQVFPTDSTQWMRLSKLCIDCLAISAKDLAHLLTGKMPNLRELTLSGVELLEGRWEGVIELLKTSMHLLSFPLRKASQTQYKEGLDFLGDWVENEESCAILHAQIEAYIVSGGRHPYLRPDEDTSASRKYLLDLGL